MVLRKDQGNFYSARDDLERPSARWKWAFLALVFIAGGVLMVCKGTTGVVRGLGVASVAIGLLQFDAAIRLVRFYVSGQRLRKEFGNLPWTRDYPWDPKGSSDGSLGTTCRSVVAGLFWFICCNLAVPLFLFRGASACADNARLILVGIIGFIASLLFLYFLTIRKLWHYQKFGSNRLIFPHVPYALGELFKAQLLPGRSFGRYDKMQLTLRCMQVVQKKVGRREKNNQRCLSDDYQKIYEDHIELGSGEWRVGMAPLPILITLPDLKLPTQISKPIMTIADGDGEENQQVLDTKRYWELQVRIFMKGLDCEGSFLVPIYARS